MPEQRRMTVRVYPTFIYLLVGAALAFWCVACTSFSDGIRPQQEGLGENDAAGQEQTAVVNDHACAYFYFLWGKTAEDNQRLQEAEEAYEKALLCDEESPYLQHRLAIILIKMNRKVQATEILKQIISKNPHDRENRLLLAGIYSKLGRIDEAAAVYQEILAIKEDHDTLLLLGTLYAQNKEYAKAQEILNRLIKLEDDSYLAYYYLARLYRVMHDNDKAAAAYEKALALDWFESLAYEVAEFYEELREYDKAIAVYRRILEEGESVDLAKTRLVNLYLTVGEDNKALGLLRELRSILPESSSIDITISRILLNEQKYAEAIMILEDVLRTNPEMTVVRYLLGMAYYHNQEPQKAIAQLKMIPAESELYEDAVLLQARMMSQGDNFTGAIGLLQQQIASAATRKPGFYVLLAALLREQDEIEQGRTVFEQAIKMYPDDSELLFSYGMFLEKIGEQENAMAKMQDVLALDPDNGAALNYVGYTWADNNVNLDKALEYIKKAVDLEPDDGYIRDSLGWVYFKLGRIEQAIVELEKASAMVNDPVIKEHLGDAYMQAGQVEKARASYEESYKLYDEAAKKEAVKAKIDAAAVRRVK